MSYQAFSQLKMNRTRISVTPKWYNDIIKELEKIQTQHGEWPVQWKDNPFLNKPVQTTSFKFRANQFVLLIKDDMQSHQVAEIIHPIYQGTTKGYLIQHWRAPTEEDP
jgi:hypothetical protein